MKSNILLVAFLIANISCQYRSSKVEKIICKDCLQIFDPTAFKGIILDAYNQIQLHNNPNSAEILLVEQIQKFKSSLLLDSLAFYSCSYLLLPELTNQNVKFTRELILELERISSNLSNPFLQSIIYYTLSNYYYQKRDALQCFNHAQKMLSLNIINGGEISVLEKIALGKAHELAFDYKSALKSFLEGHYLAEEIQIPFYKSFILREIVNFYIRNNLHEKAFEYKLMELDLYGQDSISYYFSLLQKLECIRRINKDGSYNLDDWEKIVNYANNNSIKRLLVFAFAFLRTSFLDANKTPELYKLYIERYPNELEQFKSFESENYYKFIAAYHESLGNIDSAEYYFQKAIKSNRESKAGYGNIYSLYLRYGDFKLRIGEHKQALDAYVVSFNAVNQLNFTKYQLIVARKLNEIYLEKNKDNDAVRFMQLYQTLQDRVDSVQHDREIVKMELENSEQIIMLQKRLETEHLHLVHQNQYNLIAVFIGLVFFILLAGVQFHIPIWIIRTLGFLAFIFLFEYFIIKLDKQIHHLTHEVPWKLFTLKVVLFSMLLPLHHWLEKIVVHYLVEKRASGGRLIKFDFQSVTGWFQKWNRPG